MIIGHISSTIRDTEHLASCAPPPATHSPQFVNWGLAEARKGVGAHVQATSSNGGYASTGLFDSPGYIRLWDVANPARPTALGRPFT